MSGAIFTFDAVVAATAARVRPGPGGPGPAAPVTDTRTLGRGDLFVALEGERFDGHDFLGTAAEAGAWGAVVRAGHPALPAVAGRLHLFEVPDTLAALGALGRAWRTAWDGGPVVAITGSNGKTTTKELLAAALTAARGPGLWTEGNLNNLVGVPLTLFRLEAAHGWAVVEMGMNAPGEIARLTEAAVPSVGLVTNAGPAHLEGLGSVDRVADAKAELYQGLVPGSVAVVNLDDPRMGERARRAGVGDRVGRVTFGTSPQADLRLHDLVVGDEGMRFSVTAAPSLGGARVPVSLPLYGPHNALNATAALAAVVALGGDLETAADGLARARNVGRRLRPVAGPRGSLILDDCYNANLLSMEAALATGAALARSRGGSLRAALGDMLELGEAEAELHRRLGDLAATHGVSRLVAFGPRSLDTARAAEAAGLAAGAVRHTESPEEAGAFLEAGLEAGDVILVKGSRGMAMERIVARWERAE